MTSMRGMPCVDHLVVAADSLAEGAEWVTDRLGVPTEPGGEHPAFGTHNRLLSLGPTDYLEILAINPAVEKPCAAYPLGLGLPEVQARLRRGPFLLTWVMRVADLAGEGVREVSRGEVRWRAIPRDDGALPLGGVMPAPIEWLTTPPWAALPDRGVRLAQLTLTTAAEAELRDGLGALGWPSDDRHADPRIAIRTATAPGSGGEDTATQAGLEAVLETARGPVLMR